MTKEKCIAYQQLDAMIKLSDGKNVVPTMDYQKWVLENSQLFSEVNVKESEEVAQRVGAKVKQCFYNCWKALVPEQYKYFEGTVATKAIPIPLEHCWLVKDGKVIDPTLIINVGKIKNRLGDEYFGVEIPIKYALKMGFKLKLAGPYLPHFYLERFEKKK